MGLFARCQLFRRASSLGAVRMRSVRTTERAHQERGGRGAGADTLCSARNFRELQCVSTHAEAVVFFFFGAIKREG